MVTQGSFEGSDGHHKYGCTDQHVDPFVHAVLSFPRELRGQYFHGDRRVDLLGVRQWREAGDEHAVVSNYGDSFGQGVLNRNRTRISRLRCIIIRAMASPLRKVTILLIFNISTSKFSRNLLPLLALLTIVLISMTGPYLKIDIRPEGACFG